MTKSRQALMQLASTQQLQHEVRQRLQSCERDREAYKAVKAVKAKKANKGANNSNNSNNSNNAQGAEVAVAEEFCAQLEDIRTTFYLQISSAFDWDLLTCGGCAYTLRCLVASETGSDAFR